MTIRRQLPARYLLPLALVGGALLLAGCGAPLPATTLDPQGNHARRIYDLLIPIFWAALAVFVVVEGLLIYAVMRFRQRPDSGIPAQIHGNTRIEIMWTIAPALIVLVIALLSFRTQAAQSYQPAQAMPIKVIGHQWWWEFQYPQQGIVTANDLYIPVGQDVTLELNSTDVIHSFWPIKLAGKTDAIPGKRNFLTFKAEQPGIYRGLCAEFCGEEHALMRFRVIAVPPETFQRWIDAQKTPPPAPTGNAQRIFLEKGCVGCHAISGFEQAVGVVGPNLTYFGSRETIAAGTLKNTPENLAKWLRDPQAVKPGNLMAAVIKPGTLTDQEIAELVAYLDGMKLTIEKPAER